MLSNRNIFSVTILLLIASFELLGQIPDTIVIPEVKVIGTSIREQSIGTPSQNWDVDKENSSVTDLASLLNQNGIFIKSYGANSLATSSIRGGSAGHSLVLWNGLPIQSPMLGQLDLSLLPINSVEKVSLQKGGSSALWGSGAIGGIVSLDHKANFNNSFSFSSNTSIGSFGQFDEQVKVSFGNKRFQFVTKILHRQADNDFSYPIAPNFPQRKQENAAFLQQSVLHDFYVNGNNGHRFSAHFWRQESDKEIPPTNVQLRSGAHQDDKATRLILNWQQARKHIVMKAKAAWFKEELNFFDDITFLESLSEFNTFFGEISGQYSWSTSHTLLLGNTISQTKVNADGYTNTPNETRAALFASYQFRKEKIQIQASLRQELVDQQWIPLTPVLGIDFQPYSFLSLQGQLSKNYRLPTFNDRFWAPGGNLDLLPESGWSEEVTVNLHHQKGPFQMELINTAFNRKIDNWIMWARLSGQSFWSANNLTKVWSRGLEERLNLAYTKGNITTKIQVGYDYILSTNEIAVEIPEMAIGVQLWYTPKHQTSVKLSFLWKQIEWSYRHMFRSSSTGFNGDMAAYDVGNFHAQYSFIKNNWAATIYGAIANSWDADYFVVEQRPIPGRNFQLGIKLNIIK
jgi:vitamin B12 transporter